MECARGDRRKNTLTARIRIIQSVEAIDTRRIKLSCRLLPNRANIIISGNNPTIEPRINIPMEIEVRPIKTLIRRLVKGS